MDATKAETLTQNRLRQDALRTWDALAQSIALLTLVMSIALSSSFAAADAGAAAPLAFVVAAIGCLCLAYVFLRFARRMASAGGIYTYIAQGLGPQMGFLGGWLYGGAFALGITFVLAIASSFLASLLAHVHLQVPWFVLFCVFVVALFLFAFFGIRLSTRTQLLLAGGSMLSVLVLVAMILLRGGAAGLSWRPFSPATLPHGFASLFAAAIFSFTSFIGFEAAVTLGEETVRPLKSIPSAICLAILVGAGFYILVSYALSVGYGVAHAQMWAADQAPLDTLARRYAGSWLAVLIDCMVVIDAFAAALAGVHLTARTLYALGRDGGIPAVFGKTHALYHSPWVGIVAALVLTLILGATLGLPLGPFELFGFLATTGSLGILLAYILVALSGIVFFLRLREENIWVKVCDVTLPVIAILLCGATIYCSVVPVPPPPLRYAPYIMGGWLVLGCVSFLALWRRHPERVRQFGQRLADE
jgi:amino acid transporter